MSPLQNILKHLPERPGVYLFKNAAGKVIYVGKSVNLRARVHSYFHDTDRLTFAKRSMVELIADMEYIETRSETEALVLETNLIKHQKPKYNILMKDDKNLTYIALSPGPVREVTRTRLRTAKSEYFGPYISGTAVSEALATLRRIFHVRSCRVVFGRGESVVNIEEPLKNEVFFAKREHQSEAHMTAYNERGAER